MKSHFDGNEGSGVAKLIHQTMEELLSHPLFGREPHPPVPPLAENLLFVVLKTGLQNRPLRC